MKLAEVCKECLHDMDDCRCIGSYHGNDRLIKRKLRALGIDDAKAFIASCMAHGRCGPRPPEPVLPAWYSQK